MERPRRLTVAILAVLLLVGTGLLAAEALVRLTMPYSTPDTVRAHAVEYEGSLFTRIRLAPVGRMVEVDPEKGWGRKGADEASARRFHINDLGFRGPPFSPAKPRGVTRVFVLGGSAVFDQNVSDDAATPGNSWPNRAAELLRERGRAVEVINAGTPSHSTTDVLGRLISEIWLYQPDVLVLYNGWNDIKNFRAWPITPERPLARLMAPWDPRSDPYRHYQGPLDRLLARSQVYMKFRTAYLRSRAAVGPEGYLPEGPVGSTYGPYGLRQYEQNVRNFVDMARNMGAEPVLMTQAYRVGNGGSGPGDLGSAARYQLLEPEALARAYRDVHRVTRAVAAEKGAPLLDAAEALGPEPGYLSDHVHLSPAGSEAMARLLADFLAPMVETPRPGSPDRP